MIERKIAERVWRQRKTAADRERYKTLKKRICYLTREAKRLNMKRYVNPNLPTKTLWRSLDSVSNTFDLKVFNAINQIKSNAIGLDGVPLKFLKRILPQILTVVTYIFNTILTTSVSPAAWKTSKIMPIAKKSETK
jgi:hypothetical protein